MLYLHYIFWKMLICVPYRGADLLCVPSVVSGSPSLAVLLQPLPKWLGPVGAAYSRLAKLVLKVEQPCPSHTAVPDQFDQDIPIMSRLELKFAGWDQIFGSLVEKVHSLTSVNTGLSGPELKRVSSVNRKWTSKAFSSNEKNGTALYHTKQQCFCGAVLAIHYPAHFSVCLFPLSIADTHVWRDVGDFFFFLLPCFCLSCAWFHTFACTVLINIVLVPQIYIPQKCMRNGRALGMEWVSWDLASSGVNEEQYYTVP